jgi:hypothetical protein
MSSSGGAQADLANSTLRAEFQDSLGSYYNSSLSATTVRGASVNLTFQGESGFILVAWDGLGSSSFCPGNGIYVFGSSGPKGGIAEVYLDGSLTQTLNLTVSHVLYTVPRSG